jgi:outer membrane protein
MKKTLVLAVLVMAGAGAQAADLLAVYRDALTYDAQFSAAKAQLDAGREKLPQGRAGLLPTIGFSANTVWNRDSLNIDSTPPMNTYFKYNTNGWAVQLTQPLFRWQNWRGYTQSELAVAQAEAQFLQARYDVIVRVAQAYFDVLLAQETLAVTQSQKAAIGEQLESAKRNFEVGTATIVDTNEAQARYDLARAQEIAADSDLTVKRQVLRSIIGKEPELLKGLKAGVKIAPPQPDDIGKWAETAEGGNAVVQQAQAGLEIASQEVDKQRAGHYPTLDLVASRSRNSQTGGLFGGTALPAGADMNATTVGLQLAIPIFSGGYTSSKDREAVALREKALSDLENARRQAALAARQAYLGVTSGLAQVSAYEAAVVSSQASLDSNKLGYEVGVRINIDVLNAQSQLYDTRQKLMKARLDTLVAELKLKSAAGNLAEEDLQAINALLE